jgi:hypothetical protein
VTERWPGMEALPFHGEAQDAFMALPAYARTGGGEVPQLGSGLKPCRVGL